MKKLIIFITLFVFVFNIKTATSQNEKLWEFNIWPKKISDMDFYDDNSLCYTYDRATGGEPSGFIIRNLLDTVVTRDIPLSFKPIGFRISREKNMIVFCTLDKIYISDLNVENMDSMEVDEFKLEYVHESEDNIQFFDVNFEENKIAIMQYLKNDGDSVLKGGQQYFSRLLIYDITTKQIVKRLGDIKSTYYLLKYSPDGKYLAVVNNHLFDHSHFVRLINTENYEEVDKIEGKDISIEGLSFSPNSKNLVITLNNPGEQLIFYSLEDFIITSRKYNYISPSFFLTNDIIASRRDLKEGINIYTFPNLDSIAFFDSKYTGFNVKYNSNSKIILSFNSPIIFIASFDPTFLSVGNKEEAFTTVYPQPSNGIFNIEFQNPIPQNISYEVYDISGNEILNVPPTFYHSGINTVKVDMKSFPAGTYYLNFTPTINQIFKLIKE